MISKQMVQEAYSKEIAQLKISPNGDGVVCALGEYWFYFGGMTAEAYDSVREYQRDIPEGTIVDEIFEVLEDFSGDADFTDEYSYYEAVLKEAGL